MKRLPKKLTLLILLILSIVALSNAEQIEVRNVRELVTPSDVIARVSLVCVIDTGANEGYTKIAYAKVTDPIKGLKPDSILEIENDAAGVVCPKSESWGKETGSKCVQRAVNSKFSRPNSKVLVMS